MSGQSSKRELNDRIYQTNHSTQQSTRPWSHHHFSAQSKSYSLSGCCAFFWDFWEPKNCEKLPLRCEERASQRCQSLKISRSALLRGDFLRNYSYNGGPGAPSELWALRYDLVDDFCMRKINLSGRAPARFLSNTVSIVPIFSRFFDRLQITTPKLGIDTGAISTQNTQNNCRYKRV